MIRICPNPIPWNKAYKRLLHFSKTNSCLPSSPPKPLILAGWAYSNDIEKQNRWEKTVEWATENGCQELLEGTSDEEFYFVKKPTSYTVGPMGGPMYRPWDFESKKRPSSEVLGKAMETLLSQWSKIAGIELYLTTRPLEFTGNKARRLLVKADVSSQPPWGGWDYLSQNESERRLFTKFRESVNEAISPHEVDHIDFLAGEIAEPND
ncbi:MAG: hypothetical protein HGB26_00575 [Desulfobulbaceae bacterium]|nr:hypothetical protein [Desulfobulbaceae bacterium]